MNKFYFVSKSKKKYAEIKNIVGMEVEWANKEILELQTDDVDELIKRKALEAFKELQRPVLVEHTALWIHAFNGLPGLHTNHFYSKMTPAMIVEYCKLKNDFNAVAESIMCYCDGKKYFIAKGAEDGYIREEGDNIDAFAWDKIFCPFEDNPEKKTYAELGAVKSTRSMRQKAWQNLKSQIDSILLENPLVVVDEEEIKSLAKLIKEKKVLLFVGAGISASLGFPSWNKLIGNLGKSAGFEPDVFEIYGDKLMLAEYIDCIDDDTVYDYVKNEFGIDDKKLIKERLEASELYKLILELDFSIIYTTNYDHLIETYYDMKGKEYTAVINIDDMKNVAGTRIMKFHGDIKDEKSIILSESHYFERMNFQSFLDVQLQADLLQYHVLYLGYSLSDVNIKLLLYRAGKRWENSDNRKQSYIFSATPNEVQRAVFSKNGITTFSSEIVDKEMATRMFLKLLMEKVNEIN